MFFYVFLCRAINKYEEFLFETVVYRQDVKLFILSVPVIIAQSVSHLPTNTKGILKTAVIANYESVTRRSMGYGQTDTYTAFFFFFFFFF